MHLKYNTTTVELSGEGVKALELKDTDTLKVRHLTATKKTASVYGTGAPKKTFLLSLALCTKAKRDELYSFWQTIDGPAQIMTYRDKDGADHSVRWVDDYFPLSQTSVNFNEGVITLEKI